MDQQLIGDAITDVNTEIAEGNLRVRLFSPQDVTRAGYWYSNIMRLRCSDMKNCLR